MKRLTNPVENLNSYVMVHGGIDRHERLLDVEWMRDVVKAEEVVASVDDARRHDAIYALREALRA